MTEGPISLLQNGPNIIEKIGKEEKKDEVFSIEVMTTADEIAEKPAEDLSSIQRYHYIEKAYEDGIIKDYNDRNSFLSILETLNYERSQTINFNMIELIFKKALDLSFFRGRNYFLPVITGKTNVTGKILVSIGQNPVECITEDKEFLVTVRPGEQINVVGFLARKINPNSSKIYSSLQQVINLDIPGQYQVESSGIVRESSSIGADGALVTGFGKGIFMLNIRPDVTILLDQINKNVSIEELQKYIKYFLFYSCKYVRSAYGFDVLSSIISNIYAKNVKNMEGEISEIISADPTIFNKEYLCRKNTVKKYDDFVNNKLEDETTSKMPLSFTKPIIENLMNVKLFPSKMGETNNRILNIDLLNLGTEVFIFDRIAAKFGPDSSAAKYYISFLQERKRNFDLMRAVENKRVKEDYEQNIILFLIEKKLGSGRYNNILKDLQARPFVNLEIIFSVLSSSEKDIIKKEREQYLASIKALAGNNCPHLRLMKKVRQELNPRRAAEMIQIDIKKYFTSAEIGIDEVIAAAKKAAKVINCNNCKFDLICPHYIEMLNVLGRTAGSNTNLKEVLAPYLTDIISGSYFCRICNELITNIDVLGSFYIDFDASLFSSFDDPLIIFLMPEVSSSCRFLVGKLKEDGNIITLPMQKIVKNVISGIYKYIVDIEKQLLRARTNSAAENENKKILFTAIYTNAFLANLCIATNLDKAAKFQLYLQSASLKDDKNDKNTAVEILKTAVSNILFTKNINISKIKNITPEFVKDKVIEAFKIIAAAKGATILQISEGESDLFNTIINDPLFLLAFDLNMLAEGRKKVDRMYIVDRFNDILGRNLKKMREEAESRKKMKKGKDDKASWPVMYANLKIPINSVPRALLDAFKNLQPINFKKMSSDEIMKVYIKATEGQYWSSSIDLLSNFKSENYLNNSADLGTLRPSSILIEQYRKFAGAKNSTIAPFVEFINFNKENLSGFAGLAASYDDSGRSHKFEIFIVKTEESTNEAELKKDDIIKAIAAGKNLLSNTKILDKKCSICNILWSKAFGPLDKPLEEKIAATLKERDDIESILRFYENRCPAGSVSTDFRPDKSIETDISNAKFQHNFKNQKCTLCGYKSSGEGMTSAERKEFYLKYRKTFLKDKDAEMYGNDLVSAEDQPLSTTVSLTPTLSVKFKRDEIEEEWKNKYFSLVATAAKMYNVPSSSFQYLGMADGRVYEELISGKISDSADRDDFRALMLSSYCKILIVAYNQLRFRLAAESDFLSENIIKIINNSGVKKHELISLNIELPTPPTFKNDIYLNKSADEKTIVFSGKFLPANVMSMLFLELCIFIHSAGKKLTPEKDKLVSSYAEFIVKNILRNDELRSKPGRFNWNVFKADELIESAEGFKDANFDEDAGVETNEDMKSAELESTADVLKNTFDIDADMDEGETADDVMEDNSVAEVD